MTTLLLFLTLHLLVFSEVLYDKVFKERHDKTSDRALAATFVFAAVLGVIDGTAYGIATYFFLRVALFDGWMGYVLKKDIFYLGDGVNDAKTDVINREIPDNLRATIWVLAYIISIIINFKLYEKII
tara:strand:- start:492 stop:872 length:381 start_codon:yes stop_codon:yes gene_type:complete